MNLQFSNCGVLKSLTSGFTSLDSTELTQLENIANKCPLDGGQGVFVARSILVQLGTYEYNDRNICEIVEERESQASQRKQKSGFYPNPASNDITLIIPSNEKCLKINILNLMGQSVLSIETPITGQTINLIELSQGLYILEFKYIDSSESFKLIKN